MEHHIIMVGVFTWHGRWLMDMDVWCGVVCCAGAHTKCCTVRWHIVCLHAALMEHMYVECDALLRIVYVR